MSYFDELIIAKSELDQKEIEEWEAKQRKQKLIGHIEQAADSLSKEAEASKLDLKVNVIHTSIGVTLSFDVYGEQIAITSEEVIRSLKHMDEDEDIDLKEEIMDILVAKFRTSNDLRD